MRRATMLLCEHVQPLPRADLVEGALGSPLSRARMREIEEALLVLLGIDLDERGRS